MADSVPNRGGPHRALVHFYQDTADRSYDWNHAGNYSHSDYVRTTKRGGFHEGDIRRNTHSLGNSYGWVVDSDTHIPEESRNMVRPKKASK